MADEFWNPGSVPAGNPEANLRAPRQEETHPAAPTAEFGEGVITGHGPDHYVHLANGAVIPGCSGGTHYHDPDMGLLPIVRTFPAGRELPR